MSDKAPIEFAFEFDNVKYYRLQDIMNLSTHRAIATLPLYSEMESRTTRAFQSATAQAIIDALTPQSKNNKNYSIKIPDALRMAQVLKERADFIFEPVTMMKLASVIFFDETEDQNIYDAAYGQKKIERWSKDPNLFFSLTSIKQLIPYSDQLNYDTRIYLRALIPILNYQLGSLLSNESSKNLDSKIINSLRQDQEMLLTLSV